MSSKLQDALHEVLANARTAQAERTKLASVSEQTVAPLHPETPTGEGLRKLAEVLRTSSADPTYEDLSVFLGGLT
jgi:hypothetical protein